MTYKMLKKILQEMPEDRLDDTATVYFGGENDNRIDGQYFEIATSEDADARQDVLDEGHLFLIVKA